MQIKYIDVKADQVETEEKGKVKFNFEGESLFAEEYALRIYEREGFSGVWCEMSLWSFIMTLLFWDIIFAEVQGAVKQSNSGRTILLHPTDSSFKRLFQQMTSLNGMPSDFFSSKFYSRRESMIENRLKEIRLGEPKSILENSYKLNYKKNARPIENWDLIDLGTLLKPFDVVSKSSIEKIMRRLITQFGQNRKGLPDLFLWKDNKGKFVEVKTKNDTLSEPQVSWITYLAYECKLPAEIFLINPSEKKKSSIVEQIEGKYFEVEVSFGKSSSKSWDDAVDLIKRQKGFEKIDQGGLLYKGIFSTKNLDGLYKILDHISHWKNKKVAINQSEVSTTEIRDALWCYKKKIAETKGHDYCRLDENNGLENQWGCKNLYGDYSRNNWANYGFIDQKTGEWVFDKDALLEDIRRDFDRLKLCPFFDEKKILKEIKAIPDRVHPQREKSWVYLDDNYNTWGYSNGAWINSWGDTNFPGMLHITGIKKLNPYEQSEFSETEGPINYSINIDGSENRKKTGIGCLLPLLMLLILFVVLISSLF